VRVTTAPKCGSELVVVHVFVFYDTELRLTAKHGGTLSRLVKEAGIELQPVRLSSPLARGGVHALPCSSSPPSLSLSLSPGTGREQRPVSRHGGAGWHLVPGEGQQDAQQARRETGPEAEPASGSERSGGEPQAQERRYDMRGYSAIDLPRVEEGQRSSQCGRIIEPV